LWFDCNLPGSAKDQEGWRSSWRSLVGTEINAGSTMALRLLDLVDLWILVDSCGSCEFHGFFVHIADCLSSGSDAWVSQSDLLSEYKQVVDICQRETTRRESGELWSEEEKSC
jgi:hypothetical protein